MNRYISLFIFLIVLGSAYFNSSSAPTNWTKYNGNPVLGLGESDSFESDFLFHPIVTFDGTTYHMWYSGLNASPIHMRTGYATSEDGINWTKYTENPVLDLGPANAWDDRHSAAGPVLVEGDTLKMWYRGANENGIIYRSGLAYSTDGNNWTKYDDTTTTFALYEQSDPVLQPGPSGDWDDNGVYITSILFEDGLYKAWYKGGGFAEGPLGYATSEDGIHWTKYDDPATTDPPYAESDPVLDFGPLDSWDSIDLDVAQVIFDGETYHMWYAGGLDFWKTGYATSPDGINWTKYENNPILDAGPFGTWDNGDVVVGTVLFQDPIYKMWYEGFGGGPNQFGYAEDFSSIAHTDTLYLNLSHAQPGLDTLLITSRVVNPNNHMIALKAYITSDDSVIIDSTDLAGQGNKIWQAEWTVPEGDRTYSIGVKTTDEESGTLHNGLLWDLRKFTTLGPVRLESEMGERDGFGDSRYDFYITLNNESTTSSVEGVSASLEIISEDTCYSNMVISSSSYESISPDQAVESSDEYQIQLENDCEHAFNLTFRIDIALDDYVFWQDTITVDIPAKVSGLEEGSEAKPTQYTLNQNFPNPFNPVTEISWQLPASSEVELSIYNLIGQKIATLVSEQQTSGVHRIEWDASNFASGVYYYKLETRSGFIQTRKLVLLK